VRGALTVDETTARREAILDALDLRTPHEWNADPENTWRIMSWSDFNRPGVSVIGPADRITRAEFDRRKRWCSGVGRLTADQREHLRGEAR
jgi:hypothetical protein